MSGSETGLFGRLMRTPPGNAFVVFMRGDTGRKIDKYVVRLFGFSLLMHVFSAWRGQRPMPVLILHSIGRKTGQRRWTVMPYIKTSGGTYLIGSNGARPNDPAWIHNLRSDPKAVIEIDRRRKDVIARLIEPGSREYGDVWNFASTLTPQYQDYQAMTTRRIPIVALDEPVQS